MKKLETCLKEKLDLNEEIELIRFNRHNTRNISYTVNVKGEPTYFLKYKSKKGYKERKVFDFLKNNPVIPTIFPLYMDKDIMVFPYKKLEDVNSEDGLDFIVNFQNSILKLDKSFQSTFSSDPKFSNWKDEKFIAHLTEHYNEASLFWEKPEELVRYYIGASNRLNDSFPKTLVHGDVHHKNLQRDEAGNYLLIDFEECCYASPTWELSRALMEVNPKDFDKFIKEYVEKIDLKGKDILRDSVRKDFIVRIASDAVGLQLMLGVEKSRYYIDFLKRNYTQKIKEILSEG